MANVCDVELHDFERFEEIELLGELIVLASESLGALDVAAIDETLGVHPALPSQRRF
jgi:hypothetical protein